MAEPTFDSYFHSSREAFSRLMIPAQGEVQGDPVENWRACFLDLFPPSRDSPKAISLRLAEKTLKGFFTVRRQWEPSLLTYADAVVVPSKGAAYDGSTGLALPRSYLTRMPNDMQAPHCLAFHLEPRWQWTGHSTLKEALYLPFNHYDIFGHFVTETLSYLWPFLNSSPISENPIPVILSGGESGELVEHVCSVVENAGYLPIFEADLPSLFGVSKLIIPEATLHLHAMSSTAYIRAAESFGHWAMGRAGSEELPSEPIEHLYISRSLLEGDVRKVEEEGMLEQQLASLGWKVYHPQLHSLPHQVATYRLARLVAGFEGSALHALALAGFGKKGQGLIVLGDLVSPDYLLQFSAQGLPGYYIYCTQPEGGFGGEGYLHLRRRSLLASVEVVVQMLEALARGF
ncbi:MAG: glycosyltransferase 61 family protein [Prochlorococcaceae cyanobacterium]|jgi:capsular polysaccharide biosynthesis protein